MPKHMPETDFKHVYGLMLVAVLFLTLQVLIDYAAIREARRGQVRQRVKLGQCYVINLKKRPDRLRKFSSAYKKSDLSKTPLKIQSAVEGGVLDLETVPLSATARAELRNVQRTNMRTGHYQLTPGAIGCYFSHFHIFQDILLKGNDVNLVFEDDAAVPRNIKLMFGLALRQVPSDWDIILFIPSNFCHHCEGDASYQTKHVRKVSKFWGTHCYAIKHKAIKKLLNNSAKLLFPIQQQIDHQLSSLASKGLLNIYSVRNLAVKQYNSVTDIQAPIDPRSINPFYNPSDL